MQKLSYSPLQQNIFNNIATDKNHLVVLALAGSGKTSTIIESFRYVPKHSDILFVAFNKKILEEVQNKVPSYVSKISTSHSLGFSTIRKEFGNVKFFPQKTSIIIKKYLKEQNITATLDLVNILDKVIKLCKCHLADIPSKISTILNNLHSDIDMEEKDFILAVCQILRRCKEDKLVVDYNDMIWFPYVYNMKPQQFDYIFIDEFQDFNAAQINLAISSCKPNGKISAFGDQNQAIYSFLGADANSIELLMKRLNPKILPLSITYRCSKNIVKFVNKIVPDLKCSYSAKLGSVSTVDETYFLENVVAGDFVLSRTNAPLIYYCLKLLRSRINSNILGKDIADEISFMIKKSEAKDIKEFLVWLDKWKTNSIKKLTNRNRDISAVLDRAACLENVCEGISTIKDVKYRVKELFHNENDDKVVMLGTIHAAKGLERNRVFVLMDSFNNKYFAKNIQEEQNIKYVAYTRAKNELYLVQK